MYLSTNTWFEKKKSASQGLVPMEKVGGQEGNEKGGVVVRTIAASVVVQLAAFHYLFRWLRIVLKISKIDLAGQK